MENRKLKTTSLDVLIDKHIGEIGTKKRDSFEYELQLDIIGETIKNIRRERNLTQEQLGELVGVKKPKFQKLKIA